MDINLPPNIENYSKTIADLQGRERLSADQKKKLAVCKLKVALWACQSEGMEVTRYNVSEILGPDTLFVFEHGQAAMLEVNWESQEDRAAMRQYIDSYRKGRGGKGGKSSSSTDFGTYK